MKNILLLLAFIAGSLITPCLAQVVPAPSEKQLQALQTLMAPARKKVEDILIADKTGQYQTYLSDIKIIAEAKDRATREALLMKLKNDHYAFIKKGFDSAVINHEEMYRAVAKILGHTNFQLDEFLGISSSSFLPPFISPLKFDTEFNCSFNVKQGVTNQALVSGCSANVQSCFIGLHSVAEFNGGCRSKGSLGNKFDLPTGTFHSITVESQFDVDYDGIAFALGGYAQSNTKVGVRLQGPGFDKVLITREDWCVAPVIWFSRYDFENADFKTQAVFTGTFSGGNSFTAQAYNETFALATPLANDCGAFCQSTEFDYIRVTAKN